MKKLIVENQNEFKFSISDELMSQKGIPYKKLYVKGQTKELTAFLKSSEDTSIKDKFGAIYDKPNWAFWFYVPKGSNGEFDVKGIVDKKVKPFIDAINDVYKYTLEVDKLLDSLESFTPAEAGEKQDTDKPRKATSDEKLEVQNRLKSFKDKILNIESSEELQNTMRLMMDVKNGKGYEYSQNNKIAIAVQRPDATIVCSPSNWKNWYNRTINPGAKPIFVCTTSSGGYKDDVTRDFLRSVGKSSLRDLSGGQQAQLHNLQNASKYNETSGDFPWLAFYDVSDTTQIPGTEDEISKDIENSRAAAASLSNRSLDGVDSTETTNEIQIIKPVYDGLLSYAKAQNIGVNRQGGGDNPNINVTSNVDAASTKLLALAILSQILHGDYLRKKGGMAAKVSADAQTPIAKKQQAEVASWQFMEAFGVKYKLADVDMNTIFGTAVAGRDAEQEKNRIAGNISKVLGEIEGAVNHLIDYVNVQIKDNAELTEEDMGMGALPQGRHVTASQIGKELGIPTDMLREVNMKTLHERLIRKVLRLI